MAKKYDLIELYNLFCASCCQLDPSLPLLYHSENSGIKYVEPDDALIAKLHDLAFDNLHIYRQLINATDRQQWQMAKLDIVCLIWDNLSEYM